MRRMAPRSELRKISKSSIIEAAVEIVSADLRELGLEAQFFKRILNK
jgi:hypothetical protein